MAEITYTIKKGDTLWGLSQKTGIGIDALARLNNFEGDQIHNLSIGQTLTLPDTNGEYDTELSLKILNIDFKAINQAQLRLTYDDQVHQAQTNPDGMVSDLMIHDHAKGIKVEFKTIEGDWIVIADHKSLPLGKKLLTITSRQMVINGSFYGKPGAQRKSKDVLKKETIKANAGIHIEPQGTSTQPKASAGGEAKAVEHDTRVEAGTPYQVAAPVFTEGNLLLTPVNEKYRKLILVSAKRHGLTPYALAALLDAEASKTKNGGWVEQSVSSSTSGVGVAQFLTDSWLEMVTNPESLMNQRLKQENHYQNLIGELHNTAFWLFEVSGTGKDKVKIPLEDTLIEKILNWRNNPEYAIDSAALYGKINLKKFSDKGFNTSVLGPADMAKLIYFLHHEGKHGAVRLLQGRLTKEDAKKRLAKQIKNKAAPLIERFNGDAVNAYTHWLFHEYIDTKINVAHFMVKPEGGAPKSMAEIATLLGGIAPTTPLAKTPAKPIKAPDQVGGAEGWHDPLDSCSLRTAGLASVRSAMFGMVRNGGTKAHQGIDLKAEPGTPIYAVANGLIVGINTQATPAVNYGKAIILEVNVNDLPEKKRLLVLAKKPEAKVVYFFYGHLSEIYDHETSEIIKIGTLIGSTGDTGNANGMNTIAKGAHLHFEVRLQKVLGKGLYGRLDPLPFINNCH